MFLVYALFLLTEPERLRYAGLTTQSLERRFLNHVKTARSGRKMPVHWWIAKHGSEAVGIVLLGSFETAEEMKRFEIAEIARLRASGQADLNITDGGESASGYRHSEETRAKMSANKTANPTRHIPDEAHRKAVGDANRLRLSDPEEKARHADKVGKLKATQVVDIKRDIWSGRSHYKIAEEWNVSYQTINNISREVSWGHVPWPIGPRAQSEDVVNFRARNIGTSLKTAKLNEEKVREIRSAFEAGVSGADIARRYGVSPATITNIRKGRIWKHVE